MRTEEQKLLSEPITVVLGGKEYKVKPLVLKEAAPWRKKFIALYSDIEVLAKIDSDTETEVFKKGMVEMLLDKPEQLIELFFDYTKLDREEIETSATSREFQAALEEVFALEAPFFTSAVKTMLNLKKSVL